MGKPGKPMGGRSGFGGPKPPKAPQPPPPEEDEFDEEEEEFDSDEELSMSGSDASGADAVDHPVDTADIAEQIQVVKTYLADPLKAFLSAPDTQATPEVAKRIYAARAICTEKVDAVLGPSSALAEKYRVFARDHLKTITEQLIKPRGELAAKQASEMEPNDLLEDGTGIMWGAVLDAVVDGVVQESAQIPIEMSEQDGDIFNFCLNIRPSYIDNDPFKGVAFEFDFHQPNPFFTNKTLRTEFHYASAQLAVDRVGLNVSGVCGVTCTTPIAWKSGKGFEKLSAKDIDKKDQQAVDIVVDAYFTQALANAGGTTPAEQQEAADLVVLWPRSLVHALFGTSTSPATVEKLRKALVDGGSGVVDEAADGPARMRAMSLELDSWLRLSEALLSAAKAPMMTLMDKEENGEDGGMYGGDEEDEEDDEEEEDDSEEEASDVEQRMPKQASKKSRAEKKGDAPPPDCKQQ